MPLDGKKPGASAAWLTALLRGQGELRQAARARDRAYLVGLIDGSGDLLAEDTFTKLEQMFAKYEADAEMNALLERAATVYGDAAVAAASWVVARFFVEEAQRRARDTCKGVGNG